MTPKEKAEELILKFREVPIEDSVMWYVGYEISKQFALIAVDEILLAITYADYGLDYLNQVSYWLEVKQEINAL